MSTHLIDQQRVGFPLEQGLDHLSVTILARQEERGEPCVVDAVHEAEFIKQNLHNVVVAVPRSLVQSSVAEL